MYIYIYITLPNFMNVTLHLKNKLFSGPIEFEGLLYKYANDDGSSEQKYRKEIKRNMKYIGQKHF